MNWKDFILGISVGVIATMIFTQGLLRTDKSSSGATAESTELTDVLNQASEHGPQQKRIVASKSFEKIQPRQLKDAEINNTLKHTNDSVANSQNQPQMVIEKTHSTFNEATKKQTVALSSSLVKALENEWPDLRNQAQLQPQPGGWRVLFVRPHSTFARSGLLEGDFIRNEYIQQMKAQDNSGEDLSQRVVRIFTQIQ